METYKVQQAKLSGELKIPPSKSQSMRALILAALGKGYSKLHNIFESQEMDVLMEVCRNLGAEIRISDANNRVEVWGFGGKPKKTQGVINVKNSGILLRFMSAVVALGEKTFTVTGDDSICTRRPVQPLIDGLTGLGATVSAIYNNGLAPIEVKGRIKPGVTKLDGKDSQAVSALLIVSAFLDSETEIYVENPGELPWIDVTLEWLRFLGIVVHNHAYTHYVVEGKANYEGFTYCVPGDWSTAAFPIVAAVLTRSELKVNNLDVKDTQGDKLIVKLLREMGVNININETEKMLHIIPGDTLIGKKIDVNDCIDALPILAVLGSFAEGETVLYNAANARKKESDRISTMATELKKMGADIEEREDGLVIRPAKLYGAEVDAKSDHRVAMSLTVAGFCAEGTTLVHDVELVSKTFPHFRAEMNRLGANIQ